MTARRYVTIAVLWAVSLVVVAVVASAQVARPAIPLKEPKVLSGADVGFRVTSMQGDVPTGEIVVRVNGEWIQVDLAPRLVR